MPLTVGPVVLLRCCKRSLLRRLLFGSSRNLTPPRRMRDELKKRHGRGLLQNKSKGNVPRLREYKFVAALPQSRREVKLFSSLCKACCNENVAEHFISVDEELDYLSATA